MQLKIIKIILELRPLTPKQKVFQDTKLLSLKQLYKKYVALYES